jgi:hypothetical protein
MLSITNEDIKKVHPDESKSDWTCTEWLLFNEYRFDFVLQISSCITISWSNQWLLFQVIIAIICIFIVDPFVSSSYTYDLTHTLQYNFTQQNRDDNDDQTSEHTDSHTCLGTRYQPSWKFVWNAYLQEPLRSQVHPRWLLSIVHGRSNDVHWSIIIFCFVVDTIWTISWILLVFVFVFMFMTGVLLQYNLNVFCRSIYLTLICRRSQRFSGTRYLKRGGNCKVCTCLINNGFHWILF